MQSAHPFQEWIAGLDRRLYALLIGAAIGALGGLVGLLIAVAGPLIGVGAVIGVLAALYILTNVSAALYGLIAVMALLPFGTFPFKIGFTPTLMDGAMGAFLLVYAFQWMTGRRRNFRLTPIHLLVLLYVAWLILSFVLGLRHARPTSADLRQFAETLLSIGMVFVLVDLLRDPASLRRVMIAVALAAGVQALMAIILFAMPDETAERTLIRLARVGYPNGGVIRYVEDNPDLGERAIGTWVDPNAFGGFMTVTAALIAPQILARKPLLGRHWPALIVLGLLALALFLSNSRASMLAFASAFAFIGLFKGYRKFWIILLLGLAAVVVLPQTQGYVERFLQVFSASDLATQMRLGEYGDAFELIARYPITGVGFTGTPDIDIYTDVASMYLIMANQIGLVGVAVYALLMAGVAVYGWRAWHAVRDNHDLRAIHLGTFAALIAALINATADLYFFRTDFHASITLFWLVVALSLTSSRLALEIGPTPESTVAK